MSHCDCMAKKQQHRKQVQHHQGASACQYTRTQRKHVEDKKKKKTGERNCGDNFPLLKPPWIRSVTLGHNHNHNNKERTMKKGKSATSRGQSLIRVAGWFEKLQTVKNDTPVKGRKSSVMNCEGNSAAGRRTDTGKQCTSTFPRKCFSICFSFSFVSHPTGLSAGQRRPHCRPLPYKGGLLLEL